jgi:non-hemolytic enterotoxin B/C
MPDNDTSQAAGAVGTAAKSQSSNALIVQNFALSVQAQPSVDLHSHTGLMQYQTEINKALSDAKESAKTYLNTVLPNAITTIANIEAYFECQNALAVALAPGTSAQAAIVLLKTVQEQATEFHTQAVGVTGGMQGLRDQFSRSSADLSQSATDLSIAVEGDDGQLALITGELSDIDGKIAGAITGVVLSGLAVVGGIIMIAVGSLAELATAGASTALVVGGVAVTAAGVGGEVGASLELASLLDLKGDLLTTRARLHAETTLAAGLSSGLGALSASAASAAAATQGMANAWSLLGDDLGNLTSDLIKGQTTVDALRLLFTTAAQGVAKTVQGDAVIIRGQLAGAPTTVDPKISAGQLVRNQAAALQAA